MRVHHTLHGIPLSPLNNLTARRKVALIGASQLDPTERPPLEDPEWDVWSCNSLWRLCLDAHGRFRADRWFELHPLPVQTPRELDEMYTCPVPLYVLEDEEAPQWERFPLGALRERWGARDYYTCTMAYQIALALTYGYQSIGLWGMELWQGTPRERYVEHRCVEYWLGVARGMGVEVVLPEYSQLISHKLLYGYQYREEAEMVERELEWLLNELTSTKLKRAMHE